ncbi:unnamed protein product, partial [Urochloa humidicola]
WEGLCSSTSHPKCLTRRSRKDAEPSDGDCWEHAVARAHDGDASTVRRRWPDLKKLAASHPSPPQVLKQKT